MGITPLNLESDFRNARRDRDAVRRRNSACPERGSSTSALLLKRMKTREARAAVRPRPPRYDADQPTERKVAPTVMGGGKISTL